MASDITIRSESKVQGRTISSDEIKKLILSSPGPAIAVGIGRYRDERDMNVLTTVISYLRSNQNYIAGYSVGLFAIKDILSVKSEISGKDKIPKPWISNLLHDFSICCFYCEDYNLSYKINTLLFNSGEKVEVLYLTNFQYTIDKLLPPLGTVRSAKEIFGETVEISRVGVECLTSGYHCYNSSILEENIMSIEVSVPSYTMVMRTGNYTYDRENRTWLYPNGK